MTHQRAPKDCKLHGAWWHGAFMPRVRAACCGMGSGAARLRRSRDDLRLEGLHDTWRAMCTTLEPHRMRLGRQHTTRHIAQGLERSIGSKVVAKAKPYLDLVVSKARVGPVPVCGRGGPSPDANVAHRSAPGAGPIPATSAPGLGGAACASCAADCAGAQQCALICARRASVFRFRAATRRPACR